MSKKYLQGYQDAASYKWDNLPIDNVFQLVDMYKARALEKGNEYFAGLAQGAMEIVMKRLVVA